MFMFIKWNMVRCLHNSFLSLGSICSIFLIVLLGLSVYHELETNQELRKLLQQEKLKTKQTKEDSEQEIARLLVESREKDNRTQEIYNDKGLCENHLAQCKKQAEKSESTIAKKKLELETFTKTNKLCIDDLKDLKYISTYNIQSTFNSFLHILGIYLTKRKMKLRTTFTFSSKNSKTPSLVSR